MLGCRRVRGLAAVGTLAVLLGLVTRASEREAEAAPRTFTVVSGGWGHGIGMSEYGANGMALPGGQGRADHLPPGGARARPASLPGQVRVGLGGGRARHRVAGGPLRQPARAGLLLVVGRAHLQQRQWGSGPLPWFPSRADPYDRGGGAHRNPNYRWSKKVSTAALGGRGASARVRWNGRGSGGGLARPGGRP
jgi:hypothetical protein